MIILLLAALLNYVSAPVATMREGPSEDTKIASQVFNSEQVAILEKQGDWVKIATVDDFPYQGWTKMSALCQREHPFLDKQGTIIARVNRLAAHLYHVKDTEYGPIKTLPFESRLEVMDQFGDLNGRWLYVQLVDGSYGYIQRGDVFLNPATINAEKMVELSKTFLGLPYTWGGRSSFGYDCSGFVQMLYRQMGVSIPRDSKQQVVWEGFREVAIENMQPGDLIFFGREANKVTHVGMYLGNDQFIQAVGAAENKPYLRISGIHDPHWSGVGSLPYRVARTLKNGN